MIGLIVFSALFLCLDQCTKRFAVVHTSQRSLALGRLLKLRCVRNPLTKLDAHRTRIVLPLGWLAALACAILLYSYAGWFHSQTALAGLALAFAGAAGNLADLLRGNCVIDFIDLGWWPVFNLADVGILTGLAVALWPRG
jgi:signal peptidase II